MFFHRTDGPAATAILTEGFRDGSGRYLCRVPADLHGVFLSDRPLDENEGAGGDALLCVSCSQPLPDGCELEEEGKPYREWIVPADFLNQHASVRLLSADEEASIWDDRSGPRPAWHREAYGDALPFGEEGGDAPPAR